MVLVPLSSLQALYVRPGDFQGGCFVSGTPERRPFCLVATRNNPLENANPAFIVFPTNATQVAASVRFAMKHNLCIMVAGTGHDFLNRHSCNDGIFIRTTLLQAESSPTAMEPTYDKRCRDNNVWQWHNVQPGYALCGIDWQGGCMWLGKHCRHCWLEYGRWAWTISPFSRPGCGQSSWG